MSRRSRRRNKVLAAMVGLAGASKLGLLPTGSTVGKGSSTIYDKAQAMRKRGPSKLFAMAPKISKATSSGITKLDPSVIKGKNPKSIFIRQDGITKGLEKFKDKEAFSKAMKSRRGETGVGFKSFLNKFILGPKIQLKTGKTIKARGGGMAMRMKPTKMY